MAKENKLFKRLGYFKEWCQSYAPFLIVMENKAAGLSLEQDEDKMLNFFRECKQDVQAILQKWKNCRNKKIYPQNDSAHLMREVGKLETALNQEVTGGEQLLKSYGL